MPTAEGLAASSSEGVAYVRVPHLLDDRSTDDILDYAIRNEHRFVSTVVGKQGRHDPRLRESRGTDELGPHRPVLEAAVARHVPGLIQRLGLSPFEPTGYELELVAHNDGAFYMRHVDLFTGAAADGPYVDDRLLSLVLYLHRRPRAFEGGELRLFPLVLPQERQSFIDVQPAHGSAIAFSSWLPHEVRPVRCPSKAFADSRFAVNCWVLRRRRAEGSTDGQGRT